MLEQLYQLLSARLFTQHFSILLRTLAQILLIGSCTSSHCLGGGLPLLPKFVWVAGAVCPVVYFPDWISGQAEASCVYSFYASLAQLDVCSKSR